jgi:hypothetical protein
MTIPYHGPTFSRKGSGRRGTENHGNTDCQEDFALLIPGNLKILKTLGI